MHPSLYAFGLLDDITGNEPVLCLIVSRLGIIEDTSLQSLDYFIFRHGDEACHVPKFHTPVLVERCRQCFLRGIHLGHLADAERNRMVEDVGLDELSVLHALNGEDVTTVGIHQEQPCRLTLIKMSEVPDETVIQSVQLITELPVFLMIVRLVCVERFVCITQRYV